LYQIPAVTRGNQTRHLNVQQSLINTQVFMEKFVNMLPIFNCSIYSFIALIKLLLKTVEKFRWGKP